MNGYKRSSNPEENAQGIVEFALVLPMLLLVMFGIIEFGRLLFIYSGVFTSSRDAARYGSAAGDIGGYTAHYQDCDGMRSAAKRFGTLVGIEDSDITIDYYRTEDHDDDPSTPDITIDIGDCPVGSLGPSYVGLGDRVVVRVEAQYQPILPMLNVPAFPISARTSRTVITNVSIEGTPAPASPVVPEVYFSEAAQSGDEESVGTMTVWFMLNVPITKHVTIPFTVGGSATPGEDYTIDGGSPVVIGAGTSRTSLTITVIDDDMDEYDETIIFTMGTPTNADLGAPSVHTATIVDDDPEPFVSFTSSGQSGGEDEGDMYLVAQLSEISGKVVTVPFSDDLSTALSGIDYSLDPASQLTIPPGNPTAFITIGVVDDDIVEEDETIVVNMGTPQNAIPGPFPPHVIAITEHTATILDNDGPLVVSFASDNQLVHETQHVIIVPVVTNARSSRDTTVYYSVERSDGITGDFQAGPSPLVIPELTYGADITITLDDELDIDQDESITVTINTVDNDALIGAHDVHTITITPQPVVWFAETSQSGSESSGIIQVEVLISPSQGEDVSVPFNLGGTAENSVDYNVTNPLVIPAGQSSGLIFLFITNDLVDEDEETVVLTLGSPSIGMQGSPYVHTVTITDDDLPPTVSFASAGQEVDENAGSATIMAQLSAPSSREVTVAFNMGGGAGQGVDYTVLSPVSHVLVFPPGEANALITLNITDDLLVEGNEDIVVILDAPVNATLGTPIQHTLTILDDEPACEIYDQNELFIDRDGQFISWDLANSSSQRLILTQLTVDWPIDAPNAPKFDYVDYSGNTIWDGNTPSSPTTVTSWIGSDTLRELSSATSTVALGFTRTLLPGDYTLSLVFYNMDLGVNCAPVQTSNSLSSSP